MMPELPHSLYNAVVVPSDSSLSISLRCKQSHQERSFSGNRHEPPLSVDPEDVKESVPNTELCTHHLADDCQVCVSTIDGDIYFRHQPLGNYSLNKIKNEPSGLLDLVYDQTPAGFFTDSPGTNPLFFADCTKDKPATYRYKTISDLPGAGYGVLVPLETISSRPLPAELPSQQSCMPYAPIEPSCNMPVLKSPCSLSKSQRSPPHASGHRHGLPPVQKIGNTQNLYASNDYIQQFRLLEEQNKKRLALAKRQRDDVAEPTSQETQEDLPPPKRQSAIQLPSVIVSDYRFTHDGLDPSSFESNVNWSGRTSEQQTLQNDPHFMGIQWVPHDHPRPEGKSNISNTHLKGLEDYQMQLMLLEKQKHNIRLAERLVREEGEGAKKVRSLKEYQWQIQLLERQNKARLAAKQVAEEEQAMKPLQQTSQRQEATASGPVDSHGREEIHNLPIRLGPPSVTVPALALQNESHDPSVIAEGSLLSAEATDVRLSPSLCDDYVMVAKEDDM